MKVFLYGFLGGAVGAAVCFGVGFLIVSTVGVPEGAYFGFGLDPWNLPGTAMGIATWGVLLYLGNRKRRQK